VRKYLVVLDDVAFGGATPVPPKRLAVTDLAARWTAASRDRAFFAYSADYLIDLDLAVIVDVEATTARLSQAHPESATPATARTRRCEGRILPRRHLPAPPPSSPS